MESMLPNEDAAERRREKEILAISTWRSPVQCLAATSPVRYWQAESITCVVVDSVDYEFPRRPGELFFDLSMEPSYTVISYYCIACQVIFGTWEGRCPKCGVAR